MNFKFWKKDKPEERGCGNFDFLTYNSFNGYSTSQAYYILLSTGKKGRFF